MSIQREHENNIVEGSVLTIVAQKRTNKSLFPGDTVVVQKLSSYTLGVTYKVDDTYTDASLGVFLNRYVVSMNKKSVLQGRIKKYMIA